MADPVVVPVKKPWLSKTLWVNLLLALAAFSPSAQEFLQGRPDIALIIPALINVVLRLVTKDKLSVE